jgi:hypothetical protein
MSVDAPAHNTTRRMPAMPLVRTGDAGFREATKPVWVGHFTRFVVDPRQGLVSASV